MAQCWWHVCLEQRCRRDCRTVSFGNLAGKSERPFQLMNFNEFWLDYSPSPNTTMCVPKLEFQFMAQQNLSDPKAPWKPLVGFAQPGTLQVEKTIDFSQDSWRPKKYNYVLRRMLGSVPDENWFYIQKQENAVMQRRMHMLSTILRRSISSLHQKCTPQE